MFDRLLGATFFRSLVFLAISGAVSSAHSVSWKCADLFEINPPVEELMERAGQIEKDVNAWVADPKPSVDPKRVAALAVQVNLVVERLLSDFESKNNLGAVVLIETEASAIKRERIAEIVEISARSFGLESPLPRSESSVRTVPISRLGIKDLAHLPPHLREKYDEFQHVLSDLENPLSMDPKWDLERIQMRELHLPGQLFTIRLNQGYRVLFSHEANGTYTIQRIRKDLTH